MIRPKLSGKIPGKLPHRQTLLDLTKSRGRITDYSKVTPVDLKTPQTTRPARLRGKK